MKRRRPKISAPTTAPPPVPSPTYHNEIRRHYFLDRYVIIAPKRNLRPDTFAKERTTHKLETAKSPAIERDPAVLEIPLAGKSAWAVKVIKNAFPALSLEDPKAYGTQEVVIETPRHNTEFSELSLDQILLVFKAYRARLRDLKAWANIRYVVVFKNDGPAAGASIAHAHSQIIALPFIPPTVELEAAGYDDYLRQHGTCPFCDLIHWELTQRDRIIFADDNFIALSPYAVREPFGVWLLPRRHAANFTDLTAAELKTAAGYLKKVTQKLDSVNISFNFFLQDSLPGEQQHFHIKVEPRPNTWGGFELSTGVIINPVAPEYAARWYQDKL